MEGRKPPPRADHPWPGEVRFGDFKQSFPHMLRHALYSFGVLGTWFLISGYLDRNRTHLWGIFRLDYTKEEILERRRLTWETAKYRRLNLPIEATGRPSDIIMAFQTSQDKVDPGLTLKLPTRSPTGGLAGLRES